MTAEGVNFYSPCVLVLIALGGNAMTGPDGSARPGEQIAAIRRAAEPIADLAASGVTVAVTHGNGPQVGNLLTKNELAAGIVPPVPLDWCVAQTQGTLGFILVTELERALARRGVERPVASVVSRTLVDHDDPAFTEPTKPIGRYLPAEQAAPLIEHGQTWRDFGDRGWRRVVASPRPRQVLDVAAARALLTAGFIVVAGGGGGIPMAYNADRELVGVEAVIDKDLNAALLGRELGADILVIATDVPHAVVGYGTPDAQPLGAISVEELRRYAVAGHFGSGSMGPKVEAACRFVEAGGTRAVITSLDQIAAGVRGETGTVVTAS